MLTYILECLFVSAFIGFLIITYLTNTQFKNDIKNIFKYQTDDDLNLKNKELSELDNNSETAANRIQSFCQKLIFAALTSFLLFKGIIELIDTFSPISLSSSHFITHFKEIKTLSYVAKALAISCGFQLAFMLITKGPDEAVEPIMLGIASVILLMLSVIEPSEWTIQNSLSITLLIVCIGGLFFLSKKLDKKK